MITSYHRNQKIVLSQKSGKITVKVNGITVTKDAEGAEEALRIGRAFIDKMQGIGSEQALTAAKA